MFNCAESPDPEAIKEHLVSLAKTALPRHMGGKYAKVVETCLCCLDEGNADFGDEYGFEQGDDVSISVRYIDKV
jgi:hypothetical protein